MHSCETKFKAAEMYKMHIIYRRIKNLYTGFIPSIVRIKIIKMISGEIKITNTWETIESSNHVQNYKSFFSDTFRVIEGVVVDRHFADKSAKTLGTA